MKIGILTHKPRCNYGGILQAWALQTALERLGHTAEVFTSPLPPPAPLPWGVFVKRFVRKCLSRGGNTPVFYEVGLWKRMVGGTQGFIHRKINLSMVDTLSQIPCDDYDAIVVGSDQVWRKQYFNPMWETVNSADAFLDFTSDTDMKRVAYAASLGIDSWDFDADETTSIIRCLHRFDAVSVREQSAVGIIEREIGLRPEFVCDPTLLLDADDYVAACGMNSMPRSGLGVVSYILDNNPEKERLATGMAAAKGMPRKELNQFGVYNRPAISVEEWLAGFAGADMVVTDSFHGCMFSIIFRKPLVFVGNEVRGNARFQSLIDTFALDGNFIANADNCDLSAQYALPDNIDTIVARLRNYSTDFLLDALR